MLELQFTRPATRPPAGGFGYAHIELGNPRPTVNVRVDAGDYAVFARQFVVPPLDVVRRWVAAKSFNRKDLADFYAGGGAELASEQEAFRVTGGEFFKAQPEHNCPAGIRLDFAHGNSVWIDADQVRFQLNNYPDFAVAFLQAFPPDTSVTYQIFVRDISGYSYPDRLSREPTELPVAEAIQKLEAELREAAEANTV